MKRVFSTYRVDIDNIHLRYKEKLKDHETPNLISESKIESLVSSLGPVVSGILFYTP